ncbi:alpha 1,2-manosidase [Microbacterium phage phiMiGM15]
MARTAKSGYMKDNRGRRLDEFPVAGLADRSAPVNLAILGDSLANYGEGVATYIEILSNQRLRFTDIDGAGKRVYSYPGQTSGIVRTHLADVTELANKPDACIVQVGTNDAIAGWTIPATIAELETICQALEEVGIRPIVSTIPPLGGSFQHSAIRQPARALNIAIRRSAQKNKRFLIDPYLELVEPTTGSFKSAYDSGDNVHPNTAGVKAWAQLIITALGGIGTTDYNLLERVNDGNSLIGGVRIANGNGVWGGSTNSGLGSEFGVTSPPAGYTPSLVADALAGINWQRFTVSGASAALTMFQASAAVVTPGQLIQAAVRVRTGQDIGGTSRFQVYMRTYGSGTDVNIPLTGAFGLTRQVDGLALATFKVPAGQNRAQLIVLVPPVNGTYDFAQPTIQNLTALGVA